MPKLLATSLALASLALLGACTADVTNDTDDMTQSGAYLDDDADSSLMGQTSSTAGVSGIADALRARGLDVNFATAQSSSQPVFASASAYTLSINGQDIQAYEYVDIDSAEADEASISPDGGTVAGTKVTWVGTPHFYRAGNVILVYLGNNPAITQALEDVAGAPFAGEGAAGAQVGTGSTL